MFFESYLLIVIFVHGQAEKEEQATKEVVAAAAPVSKPETDYVSPTETWTTETTEVPVPASHGNWADEVAPASAAPTASFTSAEEWPATQVCNFDIMKTT